MPLIEEEEMAYMDIDIDDILALPIAAYDAPGALLSEQEPSLNAPPPPACPSHPNADDCLCHGFMNDWDVFPSASEPAFEPDYAKFEDWIPRFIRPAKPCDYCRSKQLTCHLTQGDLICRPCASLFRECSLSKSNTLESSNYANSASGEYFDTLHAVHEDSCAQHGALTGIKPLHSKNGKRSGTTTPLRNGDDEPGSSKRNGIRFPRAAIKVLRDWLDTHQEHPYPSEAERTNLESQTELTHVQIANWLANARRRKKATQRAQPKLCMSPSLRPTAAIGIPEADKPWEELNPLERWKHSPPENEPAAFSDIVTAVEHGELSDEATSPSSYNTRRRKDSSNGSKSRAPSTTSQETSIGSSLSAVSSGAKSRESNGSFGSFSSSLAGKKDRRRRRRAGASASRPSGDAQKRIFQCTFCTDSFKSKYDWTRHEKSLHLSLEKWVCAPLGPFVNDPATNEKTCVYCGLRNPPAHHGETHNHSACEEKGLDARTFYRKDHLRQHLRLMHNCEMLPGMEAWRSVATDIKSRCGFCAQRFTVWQERVDHLTAHFKAGAKMSTWKGCRGLDPSVAAQVTNAMPPYLIGIEAVSANPFSATNHNLNNFPAPEAHLPSPQYAKGNGSCTVDLPSATSGGPGDTERRATCWEILTLKLGKYVNEMAAKGVVVSDSMLQSQARWILYGDDDEWNQTAADQPEWLDLFKKAHGLEFIPCTLGGQGLNVPEDLETYGDLGIRIPFGVQLEAYNTSKVQNGNWMDSRRRQQARMLYEGLVKENLLVPAEYRCQHVECASNILDTSIFETTESTSTRIRCWCSHMLPPEKVEIYSQLTTNAQGNFKLDRMMESAHVEVQDAHDYHARAGGLQLEEQRMLQKSLRNPIPGPMCGKQSSEATVLPAWSAFDTLQRLDCRDHGNHSYGDVVDRHTTSEANTEATRWAWLQKLQDGEVICCPFLDSNEKSAETRERQLNANRARGLATLTALETAEVSDYYGPNGIPPLELVQGEKNERGFVPRHHYALPSDRAQRFETITGAWTDSGNMPVPISTAPTSDPCLDATQDSAPSLIPLQEQVELQEGYPYPGLATSETPRSDSGKWHHGNLDDSDLLQDVDDLLAAHSDLAFPMSSRPEAAFSTSAPMDLDTSSLVWTEDEVDCALQAGDFITGRVRATERVSDQSSGTGRLDLDMTACGFGDMEFEGVFDFEGFTAE